MRNKYTGDDLSARLDGTILRYNGEPVQCHAVGESLELNDIVTGSHRFTIEPDDFLLDISSVPLGYMNSARYQSAVYLKRQPFRRYKQGVVLDLLTAIPLATKAGMFGVSTGHLRCVGFVNSIKNIFPDKDTAIDRLQKGAVKSIAISREVAFLRDGSTINVFIKEIPVGVYSNGVVTVPKETDNIPSWIIISVLNELGLRTNIDFTTKAPQEKEGKTKKKSLEEYNPFDFYAIPNPTHSSERGF